MAEKRERLDKIIASQGLYSRKEIQNKIRSKAVKVNGVVVTSIGEKFDPNLDQIEIDRKIFTYQKYAYYMLNKPAGVISATDGKGKEPTVIDLVPEQYQRKNLFPAGRLDKETVGFVLLTDDGEFAHSILSPKKHISKTYEAILQHPIGINEIEQFAKGMQIGNEILKPAQLERIDDDQQNHVKIILTEGKYHQIRRMMKALDNEVLWLKRTKMGFLSLDSNLLEGKMRPISEKELLLIQEK